VEGVDEAGIIIIEMIGINILGIIFKYGEVKLNVPSKI
jgi:hypothetical protein